jgi:hypothetical protein
MGQLRMQYCLSWFSGHWQFNTTHRSGVQTSRLEPATTCQNLLMLVRSPPCVINACTKGLVGVAVHGLWRLRDAAVQKSDLNCSTEAVLRRHLVRILGRFAI